MQYLSYISSGTFLLYLLALVLQKLSFYKPKDIV